MAAALQNAHADNPSPALAKQASAAAAKYSEAVKYYDQSIAIDPSFSAALTAKGAAYANQSRLGTAAEQFVAALKLDPGDANARAYLERVQAKIRREREGGEGSAAEAAPSESSGKRARAVSGAPTPSAETSVLLDPANVVGRAAVLKALLRKRPDVVSGAASGECGSDDASSGGKRRKRSHGHSHGKKSSKHKKRSKSSKHSKHSKSGKHHSRR